MRQYKSIDYRYKCYPRFQDTDAYGIVHHSKYLCYAEEAKMAFMSDDRYFGVQVIDEECKFVVRDASLRYIQAVRYKSNEPIDVRLHFRIEDEIRVVFTFEMFYMNQKVCTGRTEHLAVGKDGQLKLSIPEGLKNKYLCLIEKGEDV